MTRKQADKAVAEIKSWIRSHGRVNPDDDFYSLRSFIESALPDHEHFALLSDRDQDSIRVYLAGYLAGRFPDHVFH